jgi:hypothetical protein
MSFTQESEKGNARKRKKLKKGKIGKDDGKMYVKTVKYTQKGQK